jgi:nitrogen fixation protein FixH
MSTTEGHDPRRGRWIPWVFVGGMLAVVAVNAVMVTAALSTFTGVTVGRAYERGRAYNEVLEEAARQDALGWQAQVAFADEVLRVRVLDREGHPVPGRLSGRMVRPVEGAAEPLDFVAVAPGHWIAAAGGRPGQWEARLTLAGPEGRHLDIRHRFLLP